MTLVPEGFDWIIGHTNSGLTIHAEVGGRGGEYQRFAATPALALCAAALRARDASADTHPKDGDVKQAPSRSDESGGAGGNRTRKAA
jgi:hypothetical protein